MLAVDGVHFVPSRPHAGQRRVERNGVHRRTVISAVTMPVGTARMPQPSSIISDAMNRPMSVFGAMSPNPTVVTVVIAQYTETGMLVNPFSGRSTR